MANKAVLFVDLLGVQKMWAENGAAAVKNRIDEFNLFILEQINFLPSELHREGEYTVILSGDSVSVMCQDFDQALGIGIHLFMQAFYDSDKRPRPFWLRGAIARWRNQYLTVNSVPIQAKGMQIGTQYQSEDDYLHVLALEKSGFRGMRLIIDKSLLHNSGFDYQEKWSSCNKTLGVVATLKECTYPKGGDFADVLWMVKSEKQYEQIKGIMAARFKKSVKDQDEFTQAAWTRVVFDQVESLIWGCRQ